MPKITELYAFIAEDNGPEDEGIMGMNFSGQWIPFIGADMKRVDDLRNYAEQIKQHTGKPYKIKYFKLVE